MLAVAFENAFRQIGSLGRYLGFRGWTMTRLISWVKKALVQDSAGDWLLILDNFDGLDLVFGNSSHKIGHLMQPI